MDDNDKIIGKLIQKRKNENDAFAKLLDAIERMKDEYEQKKDTQRKNTNL